MVLENALFSLLQDEERRRELAVLGTALAERYSWDRVIDQVLEAYEDALRIGPRVVREPAVPWLTQIRYSLRSKAD
jgi:hypothetical protein